jgi:hypothetical protein
MISILASLNLELSPPPDVVAALLLRNAESDWRELRAL